MTRDQIIQHINISAQHYYSREQVIALLNKLTKLDEPKPGETINKRNESNT